MHALQISLHEILFLYVYVKPKWNKTLENELFITPPSFTYFYSFLVDPLLATLMIYVYTCPNPPHAPRPSSDTTFSRKTPVSAPSRK